MRPSRAHMKKAAFKITFEGGLLLKMASRLLRQGI